MQYSVLGTDGSQYGPVDLMTLKQWVSEGRVLPNTQIVDNLSSQTLMASQMPELGMTSVSNPYSNTAAPPQNFNQYPRTGYDAQAPQGTTKLWSILIWLGIGIVFSMFTRYGGVFVTGWNVFDAFQAKARKDPKGDLCLVFGIGGFVLVLLWTVFKYQATQIVTGRGGG